MKICVDAKSIRASAKGFFGLFADKKGKGPVSTKKQPLLSLDNCHPQPWIVADDAVFLLQSLEDIRLSAYLKFIRKHSIYYVVAACTAKGALTGSQLFSLCYVMNHLNKFSQYECRPRERRTPEGLSLTTIKLTGKTGLLLSDQKNDLCAMLQRSADIPPSSPTPCMSAR